MIKAIVFDLDGMIILAESLFSETVSKEYNLDKKALLGFFQEDYKLCRIGRLETKDALIRHIPRFGWEGTVDRFIQLWADHGKIDDRMISIVLELRKKGIICLLCTNNERYRMQFLIRKHGLDKIFDHLLLSCELGFCKPEKKMFEKILEKAGARPDEILFLDDKPESIKAAAGFGFVAELFTGLEGFRAKLRLHNLL